jgi:septum formation protein
MEIPENIDIYEIIPELKGEPVTLASKSPRRKEILETVLGFKHVTVFPSGFAEDLDKFALAPFEYVVQTATHKAVDVYRAVVDADVPPSMVLGADTIVVVDGEIFEKPRGFDHHVQMLKQLRDFNKPHKVYTGLACIVPLEQPVAPGYALETALDFTDVYFDSSVTDEQIVEYVKSGEAQDAAGGYKIQGEKGRSLIKRIDGDFYNVVGLPAKATIALIQKTIEASQNASDRSDSEGDDF